MILQALSDYYRRRRAENPSALPARGFERRAIPFLIVIASDGSFVNLEDTRGDSGPAKAGRVFTVPQSTKRSGTQAWKASNLLWDHIGYVLGVPALGKKSELADRQHRSFVQRVIDAFGEEPSDAGVSAVLRFVRDPSPSKLMTHPSWKDLNETSGANVSFRLAGDLMVVPERESVRKSVANWHPHGDEEMQCLVSGEVGPVANLHPAIKGVRGAQSSGANIVSFNLDAFRTHGRTQGRNAPISEAVVFEYTTALNALLARGGQQKSHAGDTTIVFWAQRGNPAEDLAAALFGDDREVLDDPDRGVDRLRAIYRSAWQGHPPLRDDTSRFFVLGLAPNAARIAVRFWRVTTVSEFAAHVLQHFEDIAVERPEWAGRHPTVTALLRSTVRQERSPRDTDKRVPPNIAGSVVEAIVSGAAYPQSLFQAAVRRALVERDVTPDRAAVIRGCLVRRSRSGMDAEKELHMSLDETNDNAGYLLGRLFAVLEWAQDTASPGVNAGIRDRFYAGASTSPVSVFPTLMRMKNHHLAKIDRKGMVVALERAIGSVTAGLTEFPPRLSLPDQGRFALGYYHQRQSRFAKPRRTEETSDA